MAHFLLYFLASSVLRLRRPLLFVVHQKLSLVMILLFDVFSLNRLAIRILYDFILLVSILDTIGRHLRLSTSRGLSSSSIPVVVASRIELFWPLMTRQRSQMALLDFSIILFDLSVCLNSIKLRFLTILLA